MPQSQNPDAQPDDLTARVDELGRSVDNGFNRVDAKLESQGEAIVRLEAQAESAAGEFNRVDAKIDALSEKLAAEFTGVRKEMGAEFTGVRKEMSEGFQRLQRLMIEVGGGIVITLLVASRLFG